MARNARSAVSAARGGSWRVILISWRVMEVNYWVNMKGCLVSALTDRFHDHQYLTKDNEYLGEINL